MTDQEKFFKLRLRQAERKERPVRYAKAAGWGFMLAIIIGTVIALLTQQGCSCPDERAAQEQAYKDWQEGSAQAGQQIWKGTSKAIKERRQ